MVQGRDQRGAPEHRNETSVSIKCEKFIGKMDICQFLKMESEFTSSCLCVPHFPQLSNFIMAFYFSYKL